MAHSQRHQGLISLEKIELSGLYKSKLQLLSCTDKKIAADSIITLVP